MHLGEDVKQVGVAWPDAKGALTDLLGTVEQPQSQLIPGQICMGLDQALLGSSDPDGPLVLLAGSLFTLEEGYRHLGVEPAEQL